MMIQCASHVCPADRPVRCVENECVKSASECFYGYNLYIVQTVTFEIRNIMKDNHFYDVKTGREYLGSIRSNKKLRITVEGVGMSEIGNSTVSAANFTNQLFETYLATPATKATPVEFIRSAVVRIRGLHHEKTANPMGEVGLYLRTNYPQAIETTDQVHYSVGSPEPGLSRQVQPRDGALGVPPAQQTKKRHPVDVLHHPGKRHLRHPVQPGV